MMRRRPRPRRARPRVLVLVGNLPLALDSRLGPGTRVSAWVLATAPLVLVVVAVSLWGLARPAGSTSPAGDLPPGAAGSAGAVGGSAGAAAPRIVVSLTFDDGDKTQDLAAQLMHAHGMRGTFYVNTGKIDAADGYYLTWPQILRLHAVGNDIGGHTSTHINLTDPAIPEPVKRQEVCQDRERLQQRGLDPQSFAYPDGAVDDTAKAIVESCGYRSARSAGGLSPDGPYFAENIPPQTLTTSALYNPPGPMSLDYLQRAVLAVADHGGGWLPIIFHRICAPSDPGFNTCMAGESAVDSSVFSAFLDWLEHGAPEGTTTRTVQEVRS